MKKVCLTLSLFTLVFGLMAQTKFSVDKAHSSVNFKVKHNGISFVNGSFNTFDGFVVGDLNNLQDARIEFTVDARSIDTRIEPRDNHLREPISSTLKSIRKYSSRAPGLRRSTTRTIN